jgi:hypothetical protein
LLVTGNVVPNTDSCHPDDGGATFIRNVGSYKSHTASHPTRRYSSADTTIAVPDIVSCSGFYLKQRISETGFSLRLQVEPTQLGPKTETGYVDRTQLHSLT